MEYLGELTYKNRELLKNRVTEMCDSNLYVRNGLRGDAKSVAELLISLFLDVLIRAEDFSDIRESPRTESLFKAEKIAEVNRLVYEDYDYRALAIVLNYIKNSVRDIIFLEVTDVSMIYECLRQNDTCFSLLHSVLYGIRDELAHERVRLLNEALEHDRLRTEFLSNLTHELRTPLNVLLGTLQVMEMFYKSSTDSSSGKAKKYCGIMRQNCYRLLRLVNNIIDINKLDGGYMKLDMGNYDIVSLIANIAASVKDYIESKGIEFSFESERDSLFIACDPEKMERIILNLLSNAMKFTNSGGKIQIRLWDNNSSLFITVKDTGIGIPKEKQDQIFKRFAQIDKSLSRNYSGSGIGLSLVKSLVELHGGDITLNSDTGAGSEFLIELPIKLLPAEASDTKFKSVGDNKIEIINIEFSDIYAQL